MRFKTFYHLLLLSLLLLFNPACLAAPIQFNRDIRPILSDNCFACHGPDSGSRKGGLRLDSGEMAISDGTIVPGQAAASELIKRIYLTDPDEIMPPPESHKKLTESEKKILERWVNEGATFEKHWAFLKPVRPPVPITKDSESWARNPIDHFIAAQAAAMKLQLNPVADRNTLARRAALDATGLPPDANLLQAFMADHRPSAFERYVGALLAAKTAGEHRARYWLDAARYGDTHGMHLDNFREMWPYRDWVINAFNDNMPFDQFVIEQIAGDLLPNPSLQQRIATGFNRCNVSTAEGGSIPEELNVRYMVDRVQTTATVFLGLTAGCAVCHDHKFDPISQKEFYSLGAFFNNTTQPAMDGNQRDSPPFVVIPKPEFAKEWKQLQTTHIAVRRQLSTTRSAARKWWSRKRESRQHPVGTDSMILYLPLTQDGALELPKNAT